MDKRSPPPFAPPSFKVMCSLSSFGVEKPEWFPDEQARYCFHCNAPFSTFKRRHHCRLCGGVFCSPCCGKKIRIPGLYESSQKACLSCWNQLNEIGIKLSPNNERKKEITKEEVTGYHDQVIMDDLQSTQGTSLLDLPTDLLLHILLYLNWKEVLQCSKVCKQMYITASNGNLWQTLYKRNWAVTCGNENAINTMRSSGDLVWKDLFKQKYLSLSVHKSYDSFDFNGRKFEIPEDGIVVMLGASNTGKTSLVQYLINESFESKKSGTSCCATQCLKNVAVDTSFVKLRIWDTSGQKQFWLTAPLYYNIANVVLIVYSITDKNTFEIAKRWHAEILAKGPSGIRCAIVGCKADLKSQREVLKEDLHAFAIEHGIAVSSEVSCKTGKNIEKLFENICRYCLQQKPSRSNFAKNRNSTN